MGTVGEVEVTYPVIEVREMHLCNRDHVHHGFFAPYPPPYDFIEMEPAGYPLDVF